MRFFRNSVLENSVHKVFSTVYDAIVEKRFFLIRLAEDKWPVDGYREMLVSKEFFYLADVQTREGFHELSNGRLRCRCDRGGACGL